MLLCHVRLLQNSDIQFIGEAANKFWFFVRLGYIIIACE